MADTACNDECTDSHEDQTFDSTGTNVAKQNQNCSSSAANVKKTRRLPRRRTRNKGKDAGDLESNVASKANDDSSGNSADANDVKREVNERKQPPPQPSTSQSKQTQSSANANDVKRKLNSEKKKPDVAVRRKQPSPQPSTSQLKQTQGKVRNSFIWMSHPDLLQFIKTSPEHLGRLEHQMKNEATVKIMKNNIVVKALSTSTEDLSVWKSRCQGLVKHFLTEYSSQTLEVANFNDMYESSAVSINVLRHDVGGYSLSICGLAKDVEKKIFELKEYDKRMKERSNANTHIPYYINPSHHARITDNLIKKVYQATNVTIMHGGQGSLNLSGERHKIEQAKQMIAKECYAKTTRSIHCPEWTLKHMHPAVSGAQNCFPQVQIRPQRNQIIITGHPTEVTKVQEELQKVLVHVKKTFNLLKLPIDKQYHKCIIGKSGQMIKDLRARHQVEIHIPPENSNSRDVEIEGQTANVEVARAEILNLVANLKRNTCVNVTMTVLPHHMFRITDKIKLEIFETLDVTVKSTGTDTLILYGERHKIEDGRKRISDEIHSTTTKEMDVADWLFQHLGKAMASARTNWPEVELKFEETKIILTGHATEVDRFQKKIEEEISEICDRLACEVITVPKIYHKCIIGKGGKNIKELRNKFSVEITIPPDSSDSTDIKVQGEKDNVHGAVADILKLVKVLENSCRKEISVPGWLQKHVIGKKGCHLKKIKLQFPQVKIDIASDKAVLQGPSSDVDKVLQTLTEKVEELKSKLKFISVSIRPDLLSWVVGSNGEKVREMRQQFKIDIHYTANPSLIQLEGEHSRVDEAHEELTSTLRRLQNFGTLALKIDSSFLGRMIGKGGQNISKLKSQYPEVEDIKLPRRDSKDDKIYLTGDRAAVDMLFMHLSYTYNAESYGYCPKVLPMPYQRRTSTHSFRSQSSHAGSRSLYGSHSSIPSLMQSPTPSEVDSVSAFGGDDEHENDYDYFESPQEPTLSTDDYVRCIYKWHEAQKYVITFFNNSQEHLTKLQKELKTLGTVSIREEEMVIVVIGEIVENENYNTEKWNCECKEKIEQFFQNYALKRVELPFHNESSREKLAEEIATDHILTLNDQKTAALVFGEKAAVEKRKMLLTQYLEQKDFRENIDDVDTRSSELPVNAKVPLTEYPSQKDLADEVAIDVLQAKTFVDSIVADEIIIQKYGVYEFLTENNTMMEYIAIKSKCTILVEQIQESNDDGREETFTCISDKDSQDSKQSAHGYLSVSVEEGNITEESSDMIVNTTNKAFDLSGPLSQAILRSGGSYIQLLCQLQTDRTMRLTSSGTLPCGKILHVAIPHTNESIEELVVKILERAEEDKCKSITIPTIGAGEGGWSSQDVALGMHNGICKFVAANPNANYLRKVKIILFPSMVGKEPFYDLLQPTPTSSKSLNDSNDAKSPKKQSRGGFFSKMYSFFTGSKSSQNTSHGSSPTDENANDTDRANNQSVTHNKPETELSHKKTTSGESAKVLFSAIDKKNIDKAKEEVNKFIALHLRDFMLDNESISRMKKEQVDEIRAISVEKKVRIVLDQQKDKHLITIQGQLEYANAAYDEVRKIIETIPKGLPESWDPMGDKKMLRVVLDQKSTEYKTVVDMFNAASGTNRFVVKKIERVQNPVLYQHFQLKKDEISARVRNETVERQLFHGTSSSTVDAICNHGFNRSYAGKNATAYGKGTYFSTLSYYSDNYTYGNLPTYGTYGERQMIVANVLTGEYCAGAPSMIEPPLNPQTNERFDSVVDSMNRPTIFVVFKDASVYPSYVITYN